VSSSTAITGLNTGPRRQPTPATGPGSAGPWGGRHLGGQRSRQVVLRLTEARDPARPAGRPTERAARLAVFRWLGFYNHPRRHSTIGYRTGHLRTKINYAGHHRMTTSARDQGGRPPSRTPGISSRVGL
jgi:hypothetical protein